MTKAPCFVFDSEGDFTHLDFSPGALLISYDMYYLFVEQVCVEHGRFVNWNCLVLDTISKEPLGILKITFFCTSRFGKIEHKA